MFTRHKILLGLLSESSRVPSKTELMKWLFLLKQETCLKLDKTFYDFVPYTFGPFSFTVYRDLDDLTRYGYLNGEGLKIRRDLAGDVSRSFQAMPWEFQDAVRDILHRYIQLSQNRLVDMVYEKYPWFASRSQRLAAKKKPPSRTRAVFTAGYEGESIDLFLQKLDKARIERVVDVRNNPISRKYGFSKGTLSKLCQNLEIDYVHIPALGIPSTERRELETFEDYQELMEHYEQNILPTVKDAKTVATRYLNEKPSALVCFEADSTCCHRGRLAKAISKDTGLEILHL